MTRLETTATRFQNLQYSISDYDAWQPQGEILSTFRQALESFLEAEMETHSFVSY